MRLTTVYADACNIFFGLQYGPPAYLDFSFLGVLESLSLYCTRREDGVTHRNQEDQRLTEVLGKLPAADLLMRYESGISRQIDRIFDQLDRWRRARKERDGLESSNAT